MNDKHQLSGEQRHALLAHPDGWIATGFGSGLAPRAPGTVGSMVALLPWLALRELPLLAYIAVLGIGFVIGIWACDVAGRRIGVDDHRALVWDEFVGQWIALLPIVFAQRHWAWMFAGFALFRLFDIWKPWPIRVLDRRVHGGIGVMADDALAGIYAAASIACVLWLLR